MNDTIYRQSAIDAVIKRDANCGIDSAEVLRALPSAEPERKKMTNKEWKDFLCEQFNVSRTTAKGMLHALMCAKAEDNFKKQFSGRRNEDER